MPTPDDIRATANSTFDTIRNNPNISTSYRNNLLAKAYVTAKAFMDAIVAGNQATADKQVADLQFSLFGLSGGDALGYRDAQDKAAAIPDEATASNLMQQALENRDMQIARAIADVSLRNAWVGPKDMYAAANPTLIPKIDALFDIRKESVFDITRPTRNNALAALAAYGEYFINRPAELQNVADYTLDVMAKRADLDPEEGTN